MADSTTNVIDRPASPKAEQARRPTERSEEGAPDIEQEEAQASLPGPHAAPGRRPLFGR